MKATKRDFMRVQNALSSLCGYPAYYDSGRWYAPEAWLRDWHGVPHDQIRNSVGELLKWLDLRFPNGVPGQEGTARSRPRKVE